MTFIYRWKLYYPRQKNWASPSWLYHFPELSPHPPPPSPPIKYASFSDIPWVPENFLAWFPDFTSVLSRNSPDMEKSRTFWRTSTSLRYISYPVSRRKISQRRPKKHLTQSRDFCTINSVVCCSFCTDRNVSHTEPFGSVLFLVLLSFTCSW